MNEPVCDFCGNKSIFSFCGVEKKNLCAGCTIELLYRMYSTQANQLELMEKELETKREMINQLTLEKSMNYAEEVRQIYFDCQQELKIQASDFQKEINELKKKLKKKGINK